MKRYVVAAVIENLSFAAPAGPEPTPAPGEPAPIRLEDHLPTIAGVSTTDVTIAFAPYDPNEKAAPDEVRAYFLKAGEPIPADADGWLVPVPAIPASIVHGQVPAEGAALSLPAPEGLPSGDYVVAILVGFPA